MLRNRFGAFVATRNFATLFPYCQFCEVENATKHEAFCGSCSKIQSVDREHCTFYDVLDIDPPRFDLNLEELEKKYKKRAKEVHPDRFQSNPDAREFINAQTQSTFLNDAYGTLRDPKSRIEYLLRLEGIEVFDDEHASKRKPDVGLLMKVMELREELEDIESESDLESFEARMDVEISKVFDDLKESFDGKKDFDASQDLAVRMQYLVKVRDEARDRHYRLDD